MKLKQLQYFRLLAKNEHYSKTAEELSISQPNLSRSIAELEDELGVYLFEKSGRNNKLTKDGEFFYRHIDKGLAEIDKGVQKLKELHNPTSGIIDLAFVYTLGPTFIPSVIEKFSSIEKYKNIKFQFFQDNTPYIIQELKNYKFDLAICSYLDNEPLIDFTPVINREFVVIVSKKNPLAQLDEITLEEALKYPIIYPSDKTGTLDQIFSEAGVIPNIACYAQEDQAIVGLVSIDYGIGILPMDNIIKNCNVKILRLTKPYYRTIYMATVKNRALSPIVSSFYQFVMEHNHKGTFKA